MANLTRSLAAMLVTFHAAADDMRRLKADAGNYTAEGWKIEQERRMGRHRPSIEKITTHLDALEAAAEARWDAEVSTAIDMPKMNPTERVAAELEAARIMRRGPLEVAAVYEMVNPFHDEISHPARVLLMGEAIAAGITTRGDLAGYLPNVSELARAADEDCTTVITALNGVHRPLLALLDGMVNESRSDLTELRIDYLDMLESITGPDGLEVKGVPALAL